MTTTNTIVFKGKVVYCRKMTTGLGSGFLLMRLAVLVFICGILAAGIATVRAYGIASPQKLFRNPDPTNIAETAPTIDTSILSPDFAVSEDLAEHYSELEKKLFIPLRNFYATRDERLRQVNVVAAPDEDHSTEVSVLLMTKDGEEIKTFFFDREGEEQNGEFPEWTLSEFDNTD